MRILLALNLIFLLGCAGTVPMVVAPNNLNKIKNISCISLMGDELEIKSVGTTILANKMGLYPVSSWGIDNHIETLIQDEVNKTNSLRYIDIDYTYEDFEKIYNFTKTTAWDFDKFNTIGIQSELIKLSQKYGLDAIIIIIRSSHQPPNTNQFVNGYSLYKHSLLGVKIVATFYFVGNISIIDLSSMNKIAAYPLYTKSELKDIKWKSTLNDYTDDEKKILENSLKEKLDEVVPQTLKKIGLIN